ncbi:MAG: hypothetical protein U5O39_15510 [Gammaproteobacteria bacterium]|nr:hypothetical protein [Gammaproteobacteria bacterium]
MVTRRKNEDVLDLARWYALCRRGEGRQALGQGHDILGKTGRVSSATSNTTGARALGTVDLAGRHRAYNGYFAEDKLVAAPAEPDEPVANIGQQTAPSGSSASRKPEAPQLSHGNEPAGKAARQQTPPPQTDMPGDIEKREVTRVTDELKEELMTMVDLWAAAWSEQYAGPQHLRPTDLGGTSRCPANRAVVPGKRYVDPDCHGPATLNLRPTSSASRSSSRI